MSEGSHQYVIVCPTERAARAFQFAVDAALGIPSAGTRIGGARHDPRQPAGTLTHSGIEPHASGVWLCHVYNGNDGVAVGKPIAILKPPAIESVAPPRVSPVRELVNLANLDRPRSGLQPDDERAHWSLIAGFFREYLEDFLPGLQFDVVEVDAKATDMGPWNCDVRSFKGEEKYVLGPHEVFDLLRGAEQEASVVTWPIPIEEFGPKRVRLFYLRVPRDSWERLPRLTARNDLTGVFDGLAGAYIFTLLTYLAINAASSGPWPLEYNEFQSYRFRTNGVRVFLSATLSVYCQEPRNFHLFDQVQALSEQRYERRPTSGTIMFCAPEHEALVDWSARLRKPILLTETKRVRKLLEASAGQGHLVSDSVRVFGIGRGSRDAALRYFVKFEEPGYWTFRDASHAVLLESRQGRAYVPADRFDYARLRQHIETHLPSMTDDARSALFSVVMGAILQRHGTTVLVTTDASEAQRLSAGAFPIHPCRLSLDDTEQLTSLDGALLLDVDSRCHAIGVILDGTAEGSIGEPGRGARYNSALRYISEQRRKNAPCIILIVSEDGGVDLLPGP
jgi:hypothetical protein